MSACQARRLRLIWHAFDLINFYRCSFHQGELEGRRNWIFHREGFKRPSAPAKPSRRLRLMCHAFDLINFYRYSFYQGELEGWRNWTFDWDRFQGPSAPAKPSRRLRLLLLISSIYLDTYSCHQGKLEGGRKNYHWEGFQDSCLMLFI